MKKETKKAPTIRFRGFTDDWEQRKLLDLLDQPITDGPHETPNIVDDGVPFISADAIVNNKIDFSRKRGNITEEYNLECCKKYKPELYDVYLVKSGSTVGKVAIVEATEKFNIWSPLAAMRCQKRSNPYFLFFLLQTKKIQTQVKDKSSNGTQPNLSMRILEKFDVIVPKNKEEQLAIGCFFQKLDNTLTLHQRKLDQLKTLKKYFLQNMFPAKGEKVPRIRFKGFTGDWEQRKLGDYVTIISGDAPSKFDEGNELYVKVDDLNCNSKYVIDSKNKVALHESINKAPEGSVVFPKRGAAIMTNKVRILADDCYIDTNLMALSSNKIDSEFLYNIISKEGLYKIADTSTIPQINNKHIEPYEVLLPRLDEQRTIGKFFKDVDNFITLHQRKLDQLQTMKKFMLQNMFI